MIEMTRDTKETLTLDELRYVRVQDSHLFGLTNISGKVVTGLAAVALGSGTLGVAQALGYAGAVAGLTLSLPVTIGAAVGSFGAALAAYWLGNFDDKRIDAHNSSVRRAFHRARGDEYNRIENDFVKALQHVPEDKTLFADTLGHAVHLKDRQIATLPPHLQVQVYRTQADLELYKHTSLTTANIVETQDFHVWLSEANPTLEEQAKGYRDARNDIRKAVENGTLSVTELDAGSYISAPEKYEPMMDKESDNSFGDFIDGALDDLSRASRRNSNSGSSAGWSNPWVGGGSSSGGGRQGSVGTRSHGGFKTGGGFGGEGFQTGGSIPAAPVFVTGGGFGGESSGGSGFGDFIGSLADSGGGGGGGGGSSRNSKGAAEALMIGVAIAAASAAFIATGAAVWKNFIDQTPKPDIGGVQLPVLTKALASSRAEIQQMYAPA